MLTDDLITPAISAASGGALVATFARFALKRWLDGHDELAKAVTVMAKEINTIQVHIGFFNAVRESQQKYGQDIAVLQHDLENMKQRFERLISTMNFKYEENTQRG